MESDLQQYLLSWIPTYCCVTNSCCFEILWSDLKDLGNHQYFIIASDKIKEMTNWSPDGKIWRCACDYASELQQWIVHPKAHTRCLFIPKVGF